MNVGHVGVLGGRLVGLSGWGSGQMAAMPDPTVQQTYVLHRCSSREATGANADARMVIPGQTLTVLDTDGPGEIAHIWFTLDDAEPFYLKRVVLRMSKRWNGGGDAGQGRGGAAGYLG